MPELPEVESIVRGLEPHLRGRLVRMARLTAPDLYREGSRRIGVITGFRVTTIDRMGKAIVIHLSRPRRASSVLVIHLGMTGNLIRAGPSEPAPRRPHRHVAIRLDDGSRLFYYDPRRFGFVFVSRLEGLRARLGVGPDPFELAPDALARVLAGRRAPVKSLLLNQRLVSGLGNIYADETLFEAGIHPLTPGGRAAIRAESLLRAARWVLRRALRHGGTTIRDYRRSDGTPGAFQGKLSVYGRTGAPCLRCGTAIERIPLAGRGTHFCPRCQQRI